MFNLQKTSRNVSGESWVWRHSPSPTSLCRGRWETLWTSDAEVLYWGTGSPDIGIWWETRRPNTVGGRGNPSSRSQNRCLTVVNIRTHPWFILCTYYCTRSSRLSPNSHQIPSLPSLYFRNLLKSKWVRRNGISDTTFQSHFFEDKTE